MSHCASCERRAARIFGLTAILLAAALFANGCGACARHFARTKQDNFTGITVQGHYKWSSKVTERTLEEAGLAGPAVDGKVEVFHEEHFEKIALDLARELSSVLTLVEKETGLEYSFRLRIYLIHAPKPPAACEFSVKSEERILTFPLFMAPRSDSVGQIFRDNSQFNDVIFHEMTEASLISSENGSKVLMDRVWPNYTRWFRDGFAEYAAYVATSEIRSRHGLTAAGPTSPGLRQLAEFGEGLFTWYNGQAERGLCERVKYGASFGLFLLIEANHGREAVREIVTGLNSRAYWDGRDLVAHVSSVIGTDVRALVRDFEFPLMGFSPAEVEFPPEAEIEPREALMAAFVLEGGIAGKAGLEGNDRIISVGGVPVTTVVDMAVEILKRLDEGSAEMVVMRKNEEKVLTLDLEKPWPMPKPGDFEKLGRKTGITFEMRVSLVF